MMTDEELIKEIWNDITFEIVEKKTVMTQLAGEEQKGNIAEEVIKP